MPHVTGTARRSPRSRVSGRETPRRLASRWVRDNHAPSSTRAPTRASRPTCQVPSARRSKTSVAPTNQIVARMANGLLGNGMPNRTPAAGLEGRAMLTADSVLTGFSPTEDLLIAALTDGSVSDDEVASGLGAMAASGPATFDWVASLGVHGAGGSSGIRHAGSSSTKTGMAR